MEQLGSLWRDLHEIWYFTIFQKEYSWSFSWNFYEHSSDQVWQSIYVSDWKEAYKTGLLLSAFWMFLESLPTGFSNFHAFYCCRSDSLLPSVSQSVIQLLEYVKLSAPSNVTANLMALSLWQQHFCMLLFWTKSLVLHVMGVISCILLFAKLITLSSTLLDIIPVFQNCVWTVLCSVWSLATWTANLII